MIARLGFAMRNAPIHVVLGILFGGLISLRYSLFWAVVFATLGGAWGEHLLGRIGVPIGLLFALLFVPTFLFAVGGAIGGAVAWCLACLASHVRRLA